MINLNNPPQWIVRTILILMLGLIGPAIAQTNTVDGTNDALKQKRDPFWPVGYVPERIRIAAEQEELPADEPIASTNWNEAMKKIVINGVSSRSNDEFYAVVNGQVKSIGETVTVNHEGTIYTWAIDGIKPPGSVKLRRVSAF